MCHCSRMSPELEATRCLLRGGQELDPVTPGILRVEPLGAGKRLIPCEALASSGERLGEAMEMRLAHAERGMRLPRGRKRGLDTNVELLVANGKPETSASTQHVRLLDFRQTQ